MNANLPEFAEPDFAFPKTVEADAGKMLSEADKLTGTDAAVTRLRAVLEICAARTQIDRNTLFAQPAFVREQAQKVPSSQRAIFIALEAVRYSQIYNRSRWRYDNVDAPLEPYPADVAQWSGLQFRTRITDLLQQAVAIDDTTPLTVYSPCVDYTDNVLCYFPTVSDFVRYKAYNIYGECGITDKANALADSIIASLDASKPQLYLWLSRRYQDNQAEQWRLYNSYSEYEGARLLLQQIASSTEVLDDDDSEAAERAARRRMISVIEESLGKFPDWYGNNDLKNELSYLRRPRLSFRMPTMAAPGSEIDVTCEYSFAKSIEIRLYPLPDDENINYDWITAQEPVATASAAPSDDMGTLSIRVKTPPAGKYLVTGMLNGEKNNPRANSSVLLSTPIMPFAVNGCSDKVVAVTDFTTGMPVPGVVVRSIPNTYDNISLPRLVGRTGGDGYLVCAPDSSRQSRQSRRYLFEYNGRTYNFDGNVTQYPFDGRIDPYRDDIKLMTDRAIYHPGDSVRWTIVAASSGSEFSAPSVMANQKFTVLFSDVNGKVVDEAEVVTDDHGRAWGCFATKTDALTGRYKFSMKGGYSLNGYVMVSDFKMPTFEAEITSVERDMPSPGDVRIRGCARTFTGMPVAGAQVHIDLNGAHRWRWFVPDQTIYRVDVATDDAGVFTLDIPASAFDDRDEDERYADFIVVATVTSTAAETAEASRGFTLGKPYLLWTRNNTDIVDGAKAFGTTFFATDANGNDRALALSWQLGTASGDTIINVVASGTATAGVPCSIDLRHIGAGKYTLRLSAVDEAMADAANVQTITLYNTARNAVPDLGEPIFVPVTQYTADKKRTDVLVGISGKDRVCLYQMVRSGNAITTVAVHILKPGFHRIPVETTAGVDQTQVLFASVRNGHVYSDDVIIATPSVDKPRVVAETFRDRLTPGSRERWRFRLADGTGATLADAAMVATMYNRALDKLFNGSWPSAFSFPQAHAWLNINKPYVSFGYQTLYGTVDHLDTPPVQWPEYRYIDEYALFNGLMMKNMAFRSVEMTSASPTSAGIAYDSEAEMAVMENEDLEEAVTAETPAKQSNGADETLRTAEQLQIFWEPSLVADADGNIDLIFDMPDAIGAWTVRAFAWTPALDAAPFDGRCISSKPVMVQSALPRFLRQGDHARLLANVYNNSGDTATVTTTVELFDIATAEVFSRNVVTHTLADGASALAAIEIDVPCDMTAVGYRVCSVSGAFSDGEQCAVPVLASSAVTIESTQFYLDPSTTQPFTFTVPADVDASLTLQYCQNPIWTIVKAMRGLSNPGSTSTSKVSTLFSALAGKYITATRPDIGAVIRHWKANPSDSALVSMLDRNDDLKQLLLDQTPWVQASDNQTMRMNMLCQLLDSASTGITIDRCVYGLKDLQNNDGGFSWGPWGNRESSVWCTEVVLTTLGLARSLGLLTPDSTLSTMLERAFVYLQKAATKPERSSTDYELTLISVLWPEMKLDKAAARVVDATVADIEASWRKHDTVGKAYDIIILKARGRAKLAATILESIRQHSTVVPGRGMCFPNVDDTRAYATIIQAFATMGAPAAEIDAMRQWITVYAQACDDIGAYNPDYIIAAVLLTGTDWLSVEARPSVDVDNRPLTLENVEYATGYFSRKLTVNDGKPLTITVNTNGVTPSYGSVVSVARRLMEHIEPHATDDVSIDKRVLVRQADDSWVETSEYALGTRVRVQLTITVNRDLKYVGIVDERPAAFEPVDQLPGYDYSGGLGFYRESGNAATRLFLSYLPKGTYHIAYDMTAATEGTFISGIATLQSQYAPEITAHSGAMRITVSK